MITDHLLHTSSRVRAKAEGLSSCKTGYVSVLTIVVQMDWTSNKPSWACPAHTRITTAWTEMVLSITTLNPWATKILFFNKT